MTGDTGPQGIPGTAVNTGATGSVGPTGAVSAGAIIPFASGLPISLTATFTGLADLGAVIGFGSSFDGISVGGGSVSLVGAPGSALDMAWSAPRSGTLSSIAASYSNVLALNLLSNSATVNVTLYSAVAGSNTFTPLAATVSMVLTGNLVLGTTSSGLTFPLAIPVVAGSRYLCVASVTTAGPTTPTTLNGYISAGVNIQ